MSLVLRRIALALAVVAFSISCSGSTAALPRPSPSAIPSPSASPTEQLGPGGLTLDEEIGAVMMVGFQGPLTDAVMSDWRQRQFGGLLVVNLNHNASSPDAMRSFVSTIRSTSRHRLVAATDQEGGFVCIDISSVPCAPMPVGQADTTRMATALRSLGFDLDLGPVSDVCSGPQSVMWGRCYGSGAAAVAGAVGPVVDGIHAAGMLSAAKHFPGHGDTSVSSETQLPRIDEGHDTLLSREWPPFEAAIAHQTDFVLIGHLFYPWIDPHRSADLSPNTYDLLRADLKFHGAILSDDMEMGAITASTSTPEAAVEFLVAGGDMVMVAHHLDTADATYDAIKAAVTSGRLPRSRLDDAVTMLEALRDA